MLYKDCKGLLGDGLPSGSPHLFKNTRGLPEADHGGRSKLARINFMKRSGVRNITENNPMKNGNKSEKCRIS